MIYFLVSLIAYVFPYQNTNCKVIGRVSGKLYQPKYNYQIWLECGYNVSQISENSDVLEKTATIVIVSNFVQNDGNEDTCISCEFEFFVLSLSLRL